MSAKHTPGPWHTEPLSRIVTAPVKGEIEQVALAMQLHPSLHTGRVRDEEDANARLIAAAPDLLRSLKEMFPYAKTALMQAQQEMVGNLYPALIDAMIERAEAALTKAEWREP